MSHQDFKEIVFTKKKETKSHNPSVIVSKTDRQLLDDDVPQLKKFGTENGRIIQTARLAKKWTQDQLASQINERKNIVNQYETGNVVPDHKIVNKLRRVLNVKIK